MLFKYNSWGFLLLIFLYAVLVLNIVHFSCTDQSIALNSFEDIHDSDAIAYSNRVKRTGSNKILPNGEKHLLVLSALISTLSIVAISFFIVKCAQFLKDTPSQKSRRLLPGFGDCFKGNGGYTRVPTGDGNEHDVEKGDGGNDNGGFETDDDDKKAGDYPTGNGAHMDGTEVPRRRGCCDGMKRLFCRIKAYLSKKFHRASQQSVILGCMFLAILTFILYTYWLYYLNARDANAKMHSLVHQHPEEGWYNCEANP